VPSFHVVFTLPQLLNPLLRVNPRPLYNLLFQTVARTLRKFARDPHHLGAELGITAVLHTWGQTLTEPIHVHCIVTGGGLSPDGTQWRPSHPRFLFAVQALSQVLRGTYLAGLRRRFLLPVVPPRFVRLRHCGLLANRARQEKLARCRHLLAVVAAAATSLLPTKNIETPPAGAETAAPALCPACGGGPLRVTALLAPQRGIPP
jgi:hypothetical protein